jgi:hypothetical protein
MVRNTASDRRKGLFSGLRHTCSECAVQHAMSAAWNRLLGRVKQVCLLSLSEEELCHREPFDEMHASMAPRTFP